MSLTLPLSATGPLTIDILLVMFIPAEMQRAATAAAAHSWNDPARPDLQLLVAVTTPVRPPPPLPPTHPPPAPHPHRHPL